jgi:hypothetical protein
MKGAMKGPERASRDNDITERSFCRAARNQPSEWANRMPCAWTVRIK